MRHRIAATALTAVLVASGVGGCASNEPPQAATSPSSATAIRSPQVLGGAPWPVVPARALPANVTSPMEAEVRSWVERELLPGVRVAVVSPDGVRSVAAGVDGAGTPLKPKDQPPQPNATNEELVPTCNEAVWNVDTEDWSAPSTPSAAGRAMILRNARAGSRLKHPLLLMHDGGRHNRPNMLAELPRSSATTETTATGSSTSPGTVA